MYHFLQTIIGENGHFNLGKINCARRIRKRFNGDIVHEVKHDL